MDARGSKGTLATTLRLVSSRTHRKVSRMTDTVTVERIDIIEGPNLEGLIRPWQITEAAMPPGNRQVSLRFDEVRYMSDRESWTPIEELGVTFMPELVAIGRLGGTAMTRTRADYVITVHCALGTFEGHYNTKTRKGVLRRK